MSGTLTNSEEAQLAQTVEMFEVITQSQPQDYQSLEILKEAYVKLGRENDAVNTSKRIANAYVLMGQLSSAILEYESILQRAPDDPDVLKALGEIESKANSLNSQTALGDTPDTGRIQVAGAKPKPAAPGARPAPAEIDDGRAALHKIFVEGKVIAQAHFDLCWVPADLAAPPKAVVEPFIQLLNDKAGLPVEKSLRILSERTRLGYFPLEKYEVDLELARTFRPETCLRWCVLPFDRLSKSILVATANPFNKQAAAELEAVAKQRLLFYLAPPLDIVKALRKVFR